MALDCPTRTGPWRFLQLSDARERRRLQDHQHNGDPPDHQHPAVGDKIYLHPTAPPMRVEIVDPPNAFVLFGSPVDMGAEESWGMSTWQFAVNPGPNGGSRLLTRGRSDYTPDWKSRLAFGRFPIEVITFVMSRKMMLEIKRLAEGDI